MATREGYYDPREVSAGANPHPSRPDTQDASSGEIRSDIRRTRAEMDETVDALADRLRPRHLLDDLLDVFRGGGAGSSDITSGDMKDKAKQFGSSALSKLKNHPVPAALIGAGIAWLIFEDSSGDGRSGRGSRPGHWRDEDLREYSGSVVDARTGRPYDESYGRAYREGPGAEGSQGGSGVVEQARGKAGEFGQKISDTAGSVAESVTDAASRVGDAASQFGSHTAHHAGAAYSGARDGLWRGYDRGRSSVEHALDDYPLAATAAALAAGVLSGLLLPGTRREDELMGEQAERLKEQAKDLGREAVDRGQEVAKATADAASDEASRQGLTPSTLAEKAKHVAKDVAGAARESAKREGLTDLPGKAKAVAERGKEAAQEAGRQQKDQMKK